jgi:hypothetical protein
MKTAPQVLHSPRDLAHSHDRVKEATVDTTIMRIHSPEVSPDERPPCGCYDGWVYIGRMVEDLETGEEVEVYTAVRCRRCGER